MMNKLGFEIGTDKARGLLELGLGFQDLRPDKLRILYTFVTIERMRNKITILALCLLSFFTELQAGSTKGWGFMGSTYFNSPFGRYIFDIGAVRTWGLGKYVTLGVGGQYSYVQADEINRTWMHENQRYGIDADETLFGVKGLGTIDFTFPITNGFGVYANANITFDILPWDCMTIKKYSASDPISYDTKPVYAFNSFAPQVFAGGGVYYDFKNEDTTIRVALGYSYGYYDTLSGIRKKTFEDQNLGDHLPKGDYMNNLSLKIVFLY